MAEKVNPGAIEQEIRSLLVSAKGGLTESELIEDYREFNGNNRIPYRELGHQSLLSLLRSWPHVCRIDSGKGVNRIFAVHDDTTKHILSMVKGQKSSRRRNPPRRPKPKQGNNSKFQQNQGFDRQPKQIQKPDKKNGEYFNFRITFRPQETETNAEILMDDYIIEEESDEINTALENINSILSENPDGIRLVDLEKIYKQKFHRDLLEQLRITHILLIEDFVSEFATLSKQNKKGRPPETIIMLKSDKEIEDNKKLFVDKVLCGGVVETNFVVLNELFSYVRDNKLNGRVSEFDDESILFYLHLSRFDSHLEVLHQELTDFYSSERSEKFLVEQIRENLFCVVRFEGIYRRVLIERDIGKNVRLNFIDFGWRREIEKNQLVFKKLFRHFGEMPRMVIAARLLNLNFVKRNDLRQKVMQILDQQIISIERQQQIHGEIFQIEIFDSQGVSLSEKLIESQLACRPLPPQTPLEKALDCPLSDDDETWCEDETDDGSNSCCKIIPFDQNYRFYVVRNNEKKVFIKSTDLATLFHVPEIEILAEKHFDRMEIEPSGLYAVLAQDKAQKYQMICLLSLVSVVEYLEKFNWRHLDNLTKFLRELVKNSQMEQFWNNSKNSSDSQVESFDRKDFDRYGYLLIRRRTILSEMFITKELCRSALELESIENELRSLIAKMSSPKNAEISDQSSKNETGDRKRLKELMETCKKLINTILCFDAYVVIDDFVVDYIGQACSTLNKDLVSNNEEQLCLQYEDLSRNLTFIVNDLHEKVSSAILHE